MKQLLFLLLFPCLCVAQYTGNAGQKITLGEQTTADGLVFRGLAADTTRKPSVDTMAYILLDTNTNIIWQYKKATNNAWTRVGGSISSGVTGTLPVANGGTGATSFSPNNYLIRTNSSGNFDTSLVYEAGGNVGIGTNNPISKLDISLSSTRKFLVNFDDNIITMKGAAANGNPESIKFVGDGVRFHSGSSGSGTEIMRISSSNKVGILTNDPTEVLHVVGNARITGAYDVTTGSAANVFVTSDGVLQRSTSSIKYKSDVENYTKGLNEVMKLRPVTYKSINSNSDKIYAGFIAEELADLKLTELYENNDYGEPDAISYAYMVTLLTKAIQEQQEQITLLKKRLLILENK